MNSNRILKNFLLCAFAFSMLGLYVDASAETVSWKPINNGLKNGVFIKKIAISTNNQLFVSTEKDGLWTSKDGKSWMPNDPLFVKYTPLNIIIDQNNPSHLFIVASRNQENYTDHGDNSEIYTSNDGGKTWKIPNFTDRFINGALPNGVAINPTNSNEVLVGERNLLKSTDGGAHFNQIARNPRDPEANAFDIEFIYSVNYNSKNGNIIYLYGDGGRSGMFSKSVDGGLHWARPFSLPKYRLNFRINARDVAFVVSPNNQLYITEPGNYEKNGNKITTTAIFKSNDDGKTWENINNNLPDGVARLYIDPINSLKLYVIIDGNLYLSKTGGAAWEKVEDLLKKLNITSIAVSQGKLFVGTSDAGMYVADSI